MTFNGAISDFLLAPGPLSFRLRGFTNPATADSAYFTFTSYAYIDNAYYKIDQLDNLSINAEQGICTVTQFYPTDGNYQIYGIASNWTVSMYCEHEFDTSYSLRITLPDDWLAVSTSVCSMENGAYNASMEYDKNWIEDFPRSYNYKQDWNFDRLYCTSRSHCLTRMNCQSSYYCINKVYSQHHQITYSENMASSYSCYGSSSSNTITFSPAFSETIAARERFTFIIDSIRNPTEFSPWTEDKYEIKFEILSDTNGAVDVGTFALKKKWIEQGEIWNFQVEPQNYGVGQFPVFYKFTVQPSGEIHTDSEIFLTLPDEIYIYNEKELEKYCTYNLTGFLDPSIAYTKNYY